MALRVTQQSVDVLSEATGGKLRVTQFYIEVLGKPELGITDVLGLSDSASTATVHSPSVSDTLGITDRLIQGNAASNVLGITDAAIGNAIYIRAITDPISFSSSGSEVSVRPRALSDNLAIVGVATVNTVHNCALVSALSLIDISIGDDGSFQTAASVLAFADLVTTNYKTFNIVDTLGLTDSMPTQPIPTSNLLLLTDVAVSSLKTYIINDTLHLTDTVVDLTRQDVHDTLAFIDATYTNIIGVNVGHALILNDATTEIVIHNLFVTATLVDASKRVLVASRAVAAPLSFVQTLEVYVARAGDLCTYAPGVGSGPVTISPIPPIITPSTLTLFWPVVSPSLTVVLRNPQFGNKVSYNPNRINRKSRGGQVQVYRDSKWPQFTLLTMDITTLNQTQIDAFKSFLVATLGLVVGIIDHDGFQWSGIITTPDTTITQLSGSISCPSYATSFQAEVTPL